MIDIINSFVIYHDVKNTPNDSDAITPAMSIDLIIVIRVFLDESVKYFFIYF